MATDKPLEANRANAKRSTGPRSQGGKARSALNSTKHGLTSSEIVIGAEDPQEFDELRQGLVEDFCPQTTIERELVNRLAGYLWQLRRVPRLEAALMRKQLEIAQYASFEKKIDDLPDAALLRLVGLAKTAMAATTTSPPSV